MANALTCNGNVTKCKNGFQLAKDKQSCSSCPANKICLPNGSVVECKSINEAKVCDGGKVTLCTLGFYIADDGFACSTCSANKMCNGTHEKVCSLVVHAISYSGNVTQCDKGFDIADNKQSCIDCPLNYVCNGSFRQPCSKIQFSKTC